MDDSDKHSRVNKFEKRRKNTKVISILMIVGALLLIVLLLSWFFGGNNKDTPESSPDIPETENNDHTGHENNLGEDNNNQTHNDDGNHNDQTGQEDNKDEADEDNAENNESSENEEVDIKEVETSDQDDDVESTYTGNWQPIGTEQLEPHETQFNDETVDWEEMKQAIALAAGLDADEMIIWRIGNDGEQKAIGTVSPSDNSETYRVYISWITDEGWKPTQVEILKENEYDDQ